VIRKKVPVSGERKKDGEGHELQCRAYFHHLNCHVFRNKVPVSVERKQEEEAEVGRGMSSNAAHIFIISPESVTIRHVAPHIA
jgi:hypothetical protein